MIDWLFLLAVGIFVGFFGTLVGVGGGFILVPLLTLVYHLSPQYAVGTSLCIVALNALSGTVVYVQQKRIDYRAGIYFGLATLPGSFIGAYLLRYISASMFDIGFGVFLLFIATYMLTRKKIVSKAVTSTHTAAPHSYSLGLGIFISFFVGFFASIAGIGGGVIHVPAMIYLLKFSPFIAIPTSHFILAISATFAAASHSLIGEVEWMFLPFLGIGAVIGAQFGGKLSHKVESIWLLRGLMIAMIFVAIRLIVKHL